MLVMTISDRITRGLDILKDAKQTTIDYYIDTSEQIKNSISQAGDRAITTTIETTAQISDNVNDATRKAIENAIDYSINSWLDEHPLVFWLVTHPIWSLIISIFILFLIFGLFQAISSLFRSIWLFILRIPQKLIKKMFYFAVRYFKDRHHQLSKQNSPQKELKLLEGEGKSIQQHRVAEILQRLDKIKQEQDKLLEEIAEILESEQKSTRQVIKNHRVN